MVKRKQAYSESFKMRVRFFVAAFVVISVAGGITAGMLINKYQFEGESTATILPTSQPEKVERNLKAYKSCSFWAVDEAGEESSNLVMVNRSLTAIERIGIYPCVEGICDIEAMDSDNSGQFYIIANSKKAIYKVFSDTENSDSFGKLSYTASLSPAYNIISMSFRKSDNSLWAWAPSRGLYTINPTTGLLTLRLASELTYVDGMAWDNDSRYLYLSRTEGGVGAKNELWRYTSTTNTLESYSKLPGDTDALDFGSDGYLYGAYQGDKGTVKIYAIDVGTKEIINTQTIASDFRNIDALASCSSK